MKFGSTWVLHTKQSSINKGSS